MEPIDTRWVYLIHGGCMIVCTFGLIPLGVGIARYKITRESIAQFLRFRRNNSSSSSTSSASPSKPPTPSSIRESYRSAHGSVMFFSTFPIILSALSLFLFLPSHLQSFHSILGSVLVLFLVFIQPTLGSTDEDWQNRKWHRRLGYALWVACMCNVVLGMRKLYEKWQLK